jgi:hypothetical protein
VPSSSNERQSPKPKQGRGSLPGDLTEFLNPDNFQPAFGARWKVNDLTCLGESIFAAALALDLLAAISKDYKKSFLKFISTDSNVERPVGATERQPF